MDTDYEPPSDIPAEQYVIASMLLSPVAIVQAAELLDPEHFYRYAHEILFRAMINMYAADIRVDPVTLRAWINADGDSKRLPGNSGYIAELFALPATPVNVTHYARLVLAAALRRKGIEEAVRAVQVFQQVEQDPDEVLATYDQRLEAIRAIARPHQQQSAGFQQVTEQTAKERNPVVPGLLGEQDRLIVVAREGGGKTTLAHQVGFCKAAGVHPFQWQTQITPGRVLIADFENPEQELGDRFTALGRTAARYPGWNEANVQFYLKMGGINLTHAGEAFEFMDVIRRYEPQLLIAGPIYKMLWPLKQTDDALRAHAAVAAFFDKVRERYGTTIWLEAHAPLGSNGQVRELRPEGWNGWMKWPEFGFALHPATKAHGGPDTALDVKRFRGDRIGGRPWPAFLTRNPVPGGWPWVANWAKNVLDTPMPDDDNGWDK
jgi:replicative DNA helicase